jgi:uncharacterized membrane protein HdeD (DUF308 family)/acetyl esterase/lipase
MARTLDRLTLVRFVSRTPAWVRIVLSLVSIVLGAVIVLRPTTALDVLALLLGGGMVLTGVLELAGIREPSGERSGERAGIGEPGEARARTDRRTRRWQRALPLGWIALGIFVLAWPGLTVRGVAVITGILLLVNGAAGLGTTLRGDRGWDDRIADAAFGTTGVILGALALVWPDITLLIVAVVFGAFLIIRGIIDLFATLRRRREERAGPVRRGPVRRWGRTVVALASVVVAVAATIATAPLREGSTVIDEFYAAPRSIPHEPGRLVRAEPFTREVPTDARAWRILYTTTALDGSIRVASGLVVVPTADTDRQWPVVDWNHGTTGFAQHCAPSLQERPFWSGGMYVIKKVIAQGWAMVATDYIGLGTEGPHPYLFGRASATASLDAARAAREIDEANLSPSTVVWGHSQGGGAALWTGAIARDYAPEVWVRGVAAFAPASDPPALVDHVSDVTGGLIFASYAFAAFSDVYPEVTYSRYIRPGLEPVLRAMAGRCLTDPAIALSIVAVLGNTIDSTLFSTDPSYGELGTRLRENVAPTTIGPPVFLGQGGADSIVPKTTQDAYVKRVCADGQRIDYRRYAGYEHAQVMETYSPMIADAIAWTKARFDGVWFEGGVTCSTTDVAR